MPNSQTASGYWAEVTEQASHKAFLKTATPLDRLIADELGTEHTADPLMSFETNPANYRLSLSSYATEHTQEFLQLIRILDPEYQEMLCQYYLLGNTEERLGQLYGRSQSVTGAEIAHASRVVVGQLLLRPMTPERIRLILTPNNLHTVQLPITADSSETRTVDTAELILAFRNTRNFARVAKQFRIHRPAVRRTLVEVADQLSTQDPTQQALALYIRQLYYRVNVTGSLRLTQHKRLQLEDPNCLGAFDVDACTTDADQLFCRTAAPRM